MLSDFKLCDFFRFTGLEENTRGGKNGELKN